MGVPMPHAVALGDAPRLSRSAAAWSFVSYPGRSCSTPLRPRDRIDAWRFDGAVVRHFEW